MIFGNGGGRREVVVWCYCWRRSVWGSAGGGVEVARRKVEEDSVLMGDWFRGDGGRTHVVMMVMDDAWRWI